MENPKDYIAEKLVDGFLYFGVDPWYGLFLIMLIVVFARYKEILKWNEIPWHSKLSIITSIIAMIGFLGISLYKFFGGARL
jgi:hypothetical protein